MGGGGIELEDFTGSSHGVRIFSAADDLSGSSAASSSGWVVHEVVAVTGGAIGPALRFAK